MKNTKLFTLAALCLFAGSSHAGKIHTLAQSGKGLTAHAIHAQKAIQTL